MLPGMIENVADTPSSSRGGGLVHVMCTLSVVLGSPGPTSLYDDRRGSVGGRRQQLSAALRRRAHQAEELVPCTLPEVYGSPKLMLPSP